MTQQILLEAFPCFILLKTGGKRKKNFSHVSSASLFATKPTKTRKASVFAGVEVKCYITSYLFATERFALIMTKFLFCF